ncbi:RidA family protein [candidate division WOR-3 bacterium]|uniref:RidA family protein n=1 Tax=candidate division WOR-3 bacterium TaxID=2052148 RepID=A0A938BSL5_UNCW3|nr:RidA family protein [candidate division WOR-3 bacterium]
MDKRTAILTDKAPKPIGPYSQAVRFGNLVLTSGQIPIDPASGDLVSGDIAKETELVFANLAAVLAAAGTSLERAVKTTVFLTDMNQFGKVNEVYARHFREPFPARSTIQVAALPKGVSVEIDVVAEV